MKVLYDALPNEYTKFKYSHKTTSTDATSLSDLPACPLCSTATDSLSHLFCNCRHHDILPLRQQLTHQISQILRHTHINNPLYASTQLLITTVLSTFNSTTPDHRILLGLIHLPSLHEPLDPLPFVKTLLQDIVKLTAPFLRQCWKKYCELTHSPSSL